MLNPYKSNIAKLNEKYFTLGAGLRLHVTHDFGYILLEDSVIAKENDRKAFRKSPSFVINHTAALLLMCADGKNTVSKAIDICHSKLGNPATDFSAKLTKFIDQARKCGHIELHDIPRPTSVKITGNENMWFPLSVSFELTTNCNLKCVHCYRYSADSDNATKPDTINTEECIRVMELMSRNGVVTMEFTGGEPLLHPGFKEILNQALRLYSFVAVLTNGTLITDKLCDYIAQYTGQILFSVSLDGSSKEIHDRVRGTGTFIATTSAIKLLTSRGFRVRAGITLSCENVFDFENIILLAKDLGCANVAFNPTLPFGRGVRIKNVNSKEEAIEITEYISQVAAKYAESVGWVKFDEVRNNLSHLVGNCGAGHRAVVIAPNGDVRCCPFMPTIGPILGNIICDEYEDVFGSPLIRFFRDLPSPKEEFCSDCEMLGFCKFCGLRGMYAYANVKKDCKWAATFDIDKRLDVSILKDQYASPEYATGKMLDLGKQGCSIEG